MKKFIYFLLTLILVNSFKAQVKSKYDKEMEALQKLSEMREDEEKVSDIIYSYKTYVRNYLNQNLEYISSSDYNRISNLENTLWKSIMENKNLYSFESNFYSAAKNQLEYYKSTLVTAINKAIKHRTEYSNNKNNNNDNSRKATLFNPYETRIEGRFNGWAGDSIYKTDEGAIWQQIEDIQVSYIEQSPKVLIYENDGVIFMKVNGVKRYVKVKRLK